MRNPVALVRSVSVNRLFGNGSRHARPLNGWQSAATGSPAPPRASTAPADPLDPAITSTSRGNHRAKRRRILIATTLSDAKPAATLHAQGARVIGGAEPPS